MSNETEKKPADPTTDEPSNEPVAPGPVRRPVQAAQPHRPGTHIIDDQGFEARARGAGIHEAVEFKGGGGVLTGMRSGFKSAIGQSEDQEKQKSSLLGTFIWIMIIGGGMFFIFGGRGF